MSAPLRAIPSYPYVDRDDHGNPVIAGTTMKIVELVMAQRAYGWSPEEFHFQHPPPDSEPDSFGAGLLLGPQRRAGRGHRETVPVRRRSAPRGWLFASGREDPEPLTLSVGLYMDENVHGAITSGLRLRGIDVVIAQEDGRGGVADPLILDRATELGRPLFSQDEDLLAEARNGKQRAAIFPGSSTHISFTSRLATACVISS
jgi:hypothetical protein